MRLRRPDARYQAIASALKNGEELPEDDAYAARLVEVLGEQPVPENDVVAYAHSIWSRPYQREAMNAWILSRATDPQIEAALNIPGAVVAAYRHLFFDLKVFRNELDLLEWAANYNGTEHGQAMMKQAALNGPSGIAWMFGRGEVALDPKAVTSAVMVDTYFRARTGRLSALNSDEAKVAHSHMKTAMSAAAALSKGDTTNVLQELFIKLQHRDLTTPVTTLPPEAVLH